MYLLYINNNWKNTCSKLGYRNSHNIDMILIVSILMLIDSIKFYSCFFVKSISYIYDLMQILIPIHMFTVLLNIAMLFNTTFQVCPGIVLSVCNYSSTFFRIVGISILLNMGIHIIVLLLYSYKHKN